jgi:hypothetical protein
MQLILATLVLMIGAQSCSLLNNPQVQSDVQQLEQDAFKGVQDALSVPKPTAPTATKTS